MTEESKQEDLSTEEMEARDDINSEENAEAMQQQYYWYVIAEFYGACKHFGMEKVMLDLKTFRESVEKPKEEPRIQLLT